MTQQYIWQPDYENLYKMFMKEIRDNAEIENYLNAPKWKIDIATCMHNV